MATNINITQTNNNVVVTPNEKEVITSTTSQNIVVKDSGTETILVSSQGPQGPAGPQGPQGVPGSGSFETGSLVTTSSFNTFTSSIQTQVDNLTAATSSYVLNSQTGSFATTGSNIFIGDQTITGSLLVSGSSTLTNIGPAIFSGSLNITGGITGSLLGTSSYAVQALSATNANNVYVDAASTTTINVIPTYQADGGTDGYKSLQLSSNPLSYYYRTTNRQSGVSQQADELYIGGGANTAGGIFLNSTVGIPSYVSADGPLHLFSQGYKVQISSSANDVEIIGLTRITGSVDVKSGNVNIGSNSYFFQGTSTGGTNVSLIGVNSQDEIYIGNQGYTNIIADDTNIEGDTQITGSLLISGSGTISGSLNVTSSFTASGLNYPTVDGENGDVIQTDGAGNLSFGRTRIYAQVKNVSGGVLPKGIPVHVTSSVGNLNEVIAASASDASTMPATFILAQQLNDEEEGLGILTGFINGVNTTGFNEGEVVYVASNGGYTNQKPSGSNLIQNLGIVTKVDVNGSGFIYGSGRSNDVPNLLSGQIFFGSGSDQSHQIHISGALDQTIINNITASGNISASGQFIGDGSGLINLQRPITTHTGNFSASAVYAGNFNIVGGSLTCSISTSAAAVGAEWEFFQTSSAGNFLFETGSGITLYSKDGNIKLAGQSSAATLKKISADSFALIGDLTA